MSMQLSLKKIRQFLICIPIAASLCSCDTSRYASSNTGWNDPYNSSAYDNSTPELSRVGGIANEKMAYNISTRRLGRTDYKDGDDKDQPADNRMVIYNASLSLTVKHPDSTGKQLAALAKRYGGLAERVTTHSVILRVRADALNAAIADMEKLGKITDRSISAQDVTAFYQDDQIRLDNAEKARQKYLDLMQKAVSVADMLAVEKELDRLNAEIDVLKNRMKKVENLVQMSTITVYLTERVKPGPLGYIFVGVYKVVKLLFVWS